MEPLITVVAADHLLRLRHAAYAVEVGRVGVEDDSAQAGSTVERQDRVGGVFAHEGDGDLWVAVCGGAALLLGLAFLLRRLARLGFLLDLQLAG